MYCLFYQVGSVPAEQTNAHVPGLEEGQEYEFRVIPVNEAGPGEPSDETDRVLCKARRGELIQRNYWSFFSLRHSVNGDFCSHSSFVLWHQNRTTFVESESCSEGGGGVNFICRRQ